MHTGVDKCSSQLIMTFSYAVGAKPLKKFISIRIDAPRSRQPLVKGERLIRFELSAAMPINISAAMHKCK